MILIRNCEGFDEMEACVQLQVETWGYDDSDVIPRKAFLVAQKIGGQVIGAFDTSFPAAIANGHPESMVGFAMSLPGVKTGDGAPRSYLHSHMLAVRDAYRNRGLGTQLKLEQRREALSRDIRQMEWTFDPLEIKNAHLNIHKLGATVRRYYIDFYGVSSSRLQGGLPTDRLWPNGTWIRRGEAYAGGPRKSRTTPLKNDSGSGLHLPVEDREAGRERAFAVQLENRRKFQQAFSRD